MDVFVLLLIPIASASSIVVVVTPSQDLQQILDVAINKTNSSSSSSPSPSSSISLDLAAGLYQNNCPISIKNLPPTLTLTLTGKGPDATIVDCGSSQTRCLEIVNSNKITISGISFRNGVAAAASNFNNPSSSARSASLTSLFTRRNLPMKLDKNKSWIVFSVQVQYSLSASGKLSKRIVFPKRRPPTKQTQNRAVDLKGSAIDINRQSVGGNIVIQSSNNVDLIRLAISGGRSSSLGGGICVLDSSNINMIGCSIDRNNLTINQLPVSNFGGGGGWFSNVYSASIQNCTVSGNVVSVSRIDLNDRDITGGGGGIGISASTNVVLKWSNISSNVVRAKDTSNGNAMLVGGGLYLSNCMNTSLTGPIAFSSNTLQTYNGDCSGGGMYVSVCTLTLFTGPIDVSDNSILPNAGRGGMYGGGMLLWRCNITNFVGTVTIHRSNLENLSGGLIYGGGVYLYSSVNTVFAGLLSIQDCFSLGNGSAGLTGGGLYFSRNIDISISGLSVQNNTMISTREGAIRGGGIFIGSCKNVVVTGPALIANNSIISQWDLDLDHYAQPRTSPQCSATAVKIYNSAGTLNDGSFENYYGPNLQCSWFVFLSKTALAFTVLQINITEFDLDLGNDFLYLYDGPTFDSPLIGIYSGSISDWICYNSVPCQSINSPITVSSGTLGILFSTWSSTKGHQGFTLEWKPVPVVRTTGMTTSILGDWGLYPIIATGGGVYLDDGNVVIHDALIQSNTVQSPFFAMGAGLVVNSVNLAATLELTNVSFIDNKAIGISSIAGGLAVMSSSCSCEKCLFDGNAAIAKGTKSCYVTQGGVVCPSAFGGSVFQGYNSALNISNSIFQSSLALCDSPYLPCSATGGAISIITTSSQTSIASSLCLNSQATCSSTSVCTSVFGGCLHSMNSNVNVSNTKFVSNTASLGMGSGGAISVAGSSNAAISNCEFASNVADHGGCISITDSSSATLENDVFVDNSASSIGGVVVIRDNSNMILNAGYFRDNKASRASAMVSYNDNGVAKYTMSNSFGVVVVGSSFLMLGNSMFDKNNTWNCSQPGSVFTLDKTPSLFSLTCMACDEGTYAVDSASTLFVDRKCAPCPFGGRCLGSKDISNGLYALTDYWGLARNGSVKFYPCPSGFCCGYNQDNCTYDYCGGNRIGILCSQCSRGDGMRFFAEGCKPNSDCNDSTWFAWIIILCALIAAIMLLITTGRESSGMLSVLLYFYQMLPLVKSTIWKYTSSVVVLALQSAFSFSPTGSSDSAGICLVKSMTTSQKIGSRMLIQGLILVGLLFILGIHALMFKIRIVKQHPHVSRYVATAVRLCTIAYTTLVLVPLQMIQCVNINEKQVWWWDASIECYQGWQKAGFAAIGILSPLPLCIMILLAKRWKSEGESKQKWQKEMWKVLTLGYKQEKRYWLGISLYRRLVMIVIFTTITDGNWRSVAISGACVIFMAVNFVFQSFKSSTTHKFEAMSLLILTMLSILTSPQLSMMQFGTTESIDHEAILEWVQFVLAMLPVSVYFAMGIYQIWMFIYRRRLKELQAGEEDWIGIELGECEMCRISEFHCQQHQYC